MAAFGCSLRAENKPKAGTPSFAVSGNHHIDKILSQIGKGFGGNGENFAIIATGSERPKLLAPGATDAKNLRAFYGTVSELASRVGATTVTLVADVWTSTNPNCGRPSKDPARTEALVVRVVSPKGHLMTDWVFPYRRVNDSIDWDSAFEVHPRDGGISNQPLPSWTDEGARWFAVAFNDAKLIHTLAHCKADAAQRGLATLLSRNIDAKVWAVVDLQDVIPPAEERNCIVDMRDVCNEPADEHGTVRPSAIREPAPGEA